MDYFTVNPKRKEIKMTKSWEELSVQLENINREYEKISDTNENSWAHILRLCKVTLKFANHAIDVKLREMEDDQKK